MGYLSNPKVLSSWILGFLPYHTKWGDSLSNELWSFHPLTSDDFYASQHHLFACLLLSRRPDLTMLWTLLLYLSFFTLVHDTSPPVVYIDFLNSSASKLVTSVDFSKAPSSSTLTCLHGCCSLLNVTGMKRVVHTRYCFDSVGNTHSVLIFSQKTVSMEVNPWMEVTFNKSKSMCIIYPGWSLMMSTVFPLGKVVIFSV